MKEIKLNQIRMNSKNKENVNFNIETDIFTTNNNEDGIKAVTTKK